MKSKDLQEGPLMIQVPCFFSTPQHTSNLHCKKRGKSQTPQIKQCKPHLHEVVFPSSVLGAQG